MSAKSEFFGKNVIITGASSGIGLAAAFYFLYSGAKVLLAGRDKDTMGMTIESKEMLIEESHIIFNEKCKGESLQKNLKKNT